MKSSFVKVARRERPRFKYVSVERDDSTMARDGCKDTKFDGMQ